MTQDLNIPLGAPVWMDLVTTDVERAAAFYSELFGWTANDAPPEFNGYKYFTRNGQAVGGAMHNQPEWNAPNAWAIHLRTADVRATSARAEAHGGEVIMAPMDVGENGSFAILSDAGGAVIYAWQPGTEVGFGVLGEENAPAHFELHTRDYEASVAFYRDVFNWDLHTASDEPNFRYTTFSEPEFARAGIMDASAFLPDGAPAHWSVYIQVGDADKTAAHTRELGGTVLTEPESTPFGRIAALLDPTGAGFKIRADS